MDFLLDPVFVALIAFTALSVVLALESRMRASKDDVPVDIGTIEERVKQALGMLYFIGRSIIYAILIVILVLVGVSSLATTLITVSVALVLLAGWFWVDWHNGRRGQKSPLKFDTPAADPLLSPLGLVNLLKLIVFTVFVFAVFIASVVGIHDAARETSNGYRSRNWPSTQGILANVIDAAYLYDVDGKRYRATRVSFTDNTLSTLEHRIGDSITVYYNPANPSEAILEKHEPDDWNYSVADFASFGFFLDFSLAAIIYIDFGVVLLPLAAIVWSRLKGKPPTTPPDDDIAFP